VGILDIQLSRIQELQEALEHRKDSFVEDFRNRLTRVDESLRAILEKTEKLKSQFIQGNQTPLAFMPAKDPGVYELVEVTQLKEGNLYTFRDMDLDERSYFDLQREIFPAVVPRLESLKTSYQHHCEILTALGYHFDY